MSVRRPARPLENRLTDVVVGLIPQIALNHLGLAAPPSYRPIFLEVIVQCQYGLPFSSHHLLLGRLSALLLRTTCCWDGYLPFSSHHLLLGRLSALLLPPPLAGTVICPSPPTTCCWDGYLPFSSHHLLLGRLSALLLSPPVAGTVICPSPLTTRCLDGYSRSHAHR